MTKLGGGTRVKSLYLKDSWDKMVSNGAEANYGRAYDYTMKDPSSSKIISSGVAVNEPSIGGDENPLRQPEFYTADEGRLLPSVQFFKETPYGESFYPPPSVGYSKVTVRSIHYGASKSSRAEDVYEYYTAKDFPIRVEMTDLKSVTPVKQKSIRAVKLEEHAVQGYALILNDMHGKVKEFSNYVLKSDGQNPEKELITSTKYNYRTDDRGQLHNKVKAVKRGALVNPTYSIEEVVLGEEVDLTVDSRSHTTEINSINISMNLNTVNFAFVVIPLPTIFFPDKTDEKIFKSMVTTKVIQQYGIVESVENRSHGALTTVENLLYNSETGQVLLSRTNNEFNDKISNILFPAYWAYDNMGPSYYNVGYEDYAELMVVESNLTARLIDVNNIKNYNVGDELLLSYKTRYNDNINYKKFWVIGAQNKGINFTSYPPANPPSDCKIMIEPNCTNPDGSFFMLWAMPNDTMTDVRIKVLRSGRRNLLEQDIQSVSYVGNAEPSTFANLFNVNTYGSNNILHAGAKDFTESGIVNEIKANLGFNHHYNRFLRGALGDFKNNRTYVWNGNRSYANNHGRKDGTIAGFNFYWSLDPLSNSCDLSETQLKYNTYTTSWLSTSSTQKYNSYGLPLETLDVNLISSSVRYGFNQTFPIAVASNAKYDHIKYFGFEDLLGLRNTNHWKSGINESLPHTGNSLSFVMQSKFTKFGRQFYQPAITAFFSDAIVTNEASHTGLYCLKTTGNMDFVPLGNTINLSGTSYYFISLWVKRTNTNTAPGGILIRGITYNYNDDPVATNYYSGLNITASDIDGWYKVEGKIALPSAGANKLVDLSLVIPEYHYVDDIRICPDNALMKTFAYNMNNYRLMAEMDENNYATFYEYDEEGALIRVKKETERGIMTVNEHRKSSRKK